MVPSPLYSRLCETNFSFCDVIVENPSFFPAKRQHDIQVDMLETYSDLDWDEPCGIFNHHSPDFFLRLTTPTSPCRPVYSASCFCKGLSNIFTSYPLHSSLLTYDAETPRRAPMLASGHASVPRTCLFLGVSRDSYTRLWRVKGSSSFPRRHRKRLRS